MKVQISKFLSSVNSVLLVEEEQEDFFLRAASEKISSGSDEKSDKEVERKLLVSLIQRDFEKFVVKRKADESCEIGDEDIDSE